MKLKDAVNIYHRICDTFVDDCCCCPFSEADIRCNLFDTSEVDEEEIVKWERVATEWARSHPEPVYPTIRELINYIMAKIPGESVSYDTRIPANIAKEFNLVPINEGGLNKKGK